jgi:hypothetical protein
MKLFLFLALFGMLAVVDCKMKGQFLQTRTGENQSITLNSELQIVR